MMGLKYVPRVHGLGVVHWCFEGQARKKSLFAHFGVKVVNFAAWTAREASKPSDSESPRLSIKFAPKISP